MRSRILNLQTYCIYRVFFFSLHTHAIKQRSLIPGIHNQSNSAKISTRSREFNGDHTLLDLKGNDTYRSPRNKLIRNNKR